MRKPRAVEAADAALIRDFQRIHSGPQNIQRGNTVKSPIQKFSLAGGLVLAACMGALAADPFMLKSSAFEDNGKLAVKHAGNNKQNPNCVGENVSPPLSWSNQPAGTKSYALL